MLSTFVIYLHNFSMNSYIIGYSMTDERSYFYLLFLLKVSCRIQGLRYEEYIYYL